MIRDPVERFLSAYHEVMRRNPRRYPDLKLPSNATNEQRIFAFRLALQYRENKKLLDPHFNLQRDFVPRKAPFISFFGSDAPDRIRNLLCQAHACFHGWSPEAPSCPDVPMGEWRSRANDTYRLPQYAIKESDLEDSEVERIAKIYSKDYERFGFEPNKRLKGSQLVLGDEGNGMVG
jgi:hypothetical protein